MKYLNKIVFINSAALKYAEIPVDGNVHFIGTQGVGKSTLLRTILFFYNADKQKLGIPREKKTFDEYYFPYQNSYIVYELQTETGEFCVLAFKSQGRVAFRFFDSGYDKKYFLDNEGKAYETWDKTRETFGKNIGYTKIISSYEEYRNILYGNNKGLQNDFKKYALLESKQYQNIPRTITNVFLNTNLSAEFVKETIIKSLNEEEIKIDLTTYSQTHLKDFESNLNDIKKWTDKNRNGENQVEKQADNVSKFYSALKYLDKKKEELASQLGWALNNLNEQQPKVQEQLSAEQLKQKRVQDKLAELNDVFDKKKAEVQKQVGIFSNKLKEIKSKREEYIALKIDNILERVAKKNLLDLEKKNLLSEKEILTSKFLEIQQRFDALLKQLENQFKEYENNKQTAKNTANANFLNFKDDTGKQYETIFENIRTQYKEELEVAKSIVTEKDRLITDNKINRSEVKNKRFYEKEIEACKNEISNLKTTVITAENAIRQATENRKNIEKEWTLENKGITEETRRKTERQTEQKTKLKEQIAAIDLKIENSKDSLYGWLNEQVPDWNKTIGKVIDEENVLFKSGLNPQKIADVNLSFYGISIDTEEIDKEVKTVSDLQKEKDDFQNQFQTAQQAISNIDAQCNEDLEKLRRKFQPKIKEQKEIIQTSEYAINQSKIKLEEAGVKLKEWENKAAADKKAELENIETTIAQLSEEKIKAEGQVAKIENSINKHINDKKKEKEAKIKAEQQKLTDATSMLDSEIATKKEEIEKQKTVIKKQQKDELDTKGADTQCIGKIELQLSEIEKELAFIENNISITERYKYDKEQLFDKEDEFKSQKNLFDNQLKTESEKHEQQKNKFILEIGLHKAEIESINKTLTTFENDLSAFETFKNSEVYQSVEAFVNNYFDKHKTELRCNAIINEINQTHYNSKDRLTDLQQAINRFVGNFQENNLFSFKTKFITRHEYFEFAEMLKEFTDENKISEYKKRVEERFSHIIRQIGAETGELISKEGEISQVIRDINNDFGVRNFVGAIKSMELKTDQSSNAIFQLLIEIKNFNDENSYDLGQPNLFSTTGQTNKNEKAIELLKQLIKAMSESKEKEITLSDSFELQFKIIENDNDTGWVEKLTNVGSEGTDTLVKAMINIMLLNVFKDRAAKKNKGDFRLHCMMDEIGKLHPNNVKGILKFANDRNILLINSSPTSYNAADYRYTYILTKDSRNVTNVKRIVSKKE